MDDSATRSARALRRLRPGGWAAAAIALGLVASAAAGSIGAGAAAVGILVLALIAAASCLIASKSPVLRVSEDSLTGGQLAAAFLLFAWLSSHGGAATPAIPLLYPIAMLYGALSLGAVPLVILAAAAMVMQGTALFIVIDAGGLPPGDACAQLAALGLLFAWIIFASGSLRRLRERLAEARGALHEAALAAEQRASRDSLTGAYHQRHLMEALEREIARAERIGKPLSVARVDLDRLGAINEAFGQVAGDVALRRFTAAAGAALRDVDVLGRHGGKEFMVLMPDTDLKGAVIAAQRVLKAVGLEAAPEVAGRTRLSCTLGVAEHRKGENTRLLIGRAEAGLSYAKAGGGGMVVALEADGQPLMVENA